MPTQNQKNPASGFLIMAGFNALGAIAFIIFYFLYKDSGGDKSYLLLIAAIVAGASAVGLYIMYGVFRKKLEGVRK